MRERVPVTRDGWAVILPRACTGNRRESILVLVDADDDEDRAWQIALGWPDAQEIAHAKSRGARAFRCRITEIVDAR